MRRTRAASLTALGAAAALAMVACGTASDTGTGTGGGTGDASRNGTAANAVKGGVLNMLGSGDVDYMDPNMSYYAPAYMVMRMVSRQLYTYPADPANVTKSVPDMATAAPVLSADGKTATVTIKPGVMWNTTPPRAVTAADFVTGVKRTCNPVQPFGGLPDFEGLFVGFQDFCDGFAKVGQDAPSIKKYIQDTPLAGITAKDDSTVVLTMNAPASYLQDMLTLTAFSPAPVESLDHVPASADFGQHLVSDGPYKIDSYDPTKKVLLSRNPAWTASSDTVRGAFVDSIVLDETISQESTQQQLQTGAADADLEFDNFPPASQIPALQAANDPNLNIGESASSNPYVVFNINSPNNKGALANVKVRQALEYGINRANIIQVLGGPALNTPLTTVLPSSIIGFQQADPYPYDMAKAKQMLSDAGYPSGFTLKLLYRNASEGSSKTFATVQQDLGKIGVTVVGVASPNADFYTKYLQVPSVASEGVFDAAVAGWAPDWYGNAAISFFNPLFAGKAAFPPIGSNFGYYDSPAADSMIAAATAAQDEQTAAGLWAKADAQVMADAAFFPITADKQPNYHASQVHNDVYIPAFQGFDPTNVWLDPAKNGG